MPSAPNEIERALVIGADGFLGRHLIERAQAHGLKWVGFGRAGGDLTDPRVADAALRLAGDASHVFHVVTRQRTGSIQFDIQGEMLQINSRIHLNVLDAWRRVAPHAKLVSTGSSCTYPESPKPLPEELFGRGPLHPSVRGYGFAKQVLAEGSAVTAEQYGLKYLHVILATMYGPHDHKKADRMHFAGGMLDRAVRQMREGAREYEVWGHATTTRDLLYVSDQIDAILAANAHFENMTVNCSSNAPVTLQEVATAIVEALDWDAKIAWSVASGTGPGYKSLDASRFLTTTKWRPKVLLSEGLKAILASDYQAG